jgi:uncharacterized protein
MPANNSINYVELPARDIEATKQFFTAAFDWGFEDYGPDYVAITDATVDGGFYRSELKSSVAAGGALVVLYSDALEEAQSRVENAGGSISTEIFSFPGGRRFHFIEPSGNELAVWSEK